MRAREKEAGRESRAIEVSLGLSKGAHIDRLHLRDPRPGARGDSTQTVLNAQIPAILTE